MHALLKTSRSVSLAGLYTGGALILAAAFLIGTDVLLRRFAGTTIGGADELAQFALAIGTAWSLAGALFDRAHIRVDSAYGRFPLPVRAVLDILGIALFIFFFAFVTWHALGVVGQSWTSGSVSHSALQIPIVVPQGLWLLGLVAFLFVAAILLFDAVGNLIRGDLRAVSRSIGTKSAQEEVDEELALARAGGREDERK